MIFCRKNESKDVLFYSMNNWKHFITLSFIDFCYLPWFAYNCGGFSRKPLPSQGCTINLYWTHLVPVWNTSPWIPAAFEHFFLLFEAMGGRLLLFVLFLHLVGPLRGEWILVVLTKQWFTSNVIIIPVYTFIGESNPLRCNLGSQLCSDGLECVLVLHLCDGESDCKDGSDEENCQTACNKGTDQVKTFAWCN